LTVDLFFDTPFFPTTNPISGVIFRDGAIRVSINTDTDPVFDMKPLSTGPTSDLFTFYSMVFMGIFVIRV